MEIITKNFYSDGAEIKHGDLVYLKGYDNNRDMPFSGICKVVTCNGELFSAYFLGQEPYSSIDIEVYIEDVERLIKLDNRDIDKAIEKEMLKV